MILKFNCKYKIQLQQKCFNVYIFIKPKTTTLRPTKVQEHVSMVPLIIITSLIFREQGHSI